MKLLPTFPGTIFATLLFLLLALPLANTNAHAQKTNRPILLGGGVSTIQTRPMFDQKILLI
jgi:hypothetical protein